MPPDDPAVTPDPQTAPEDRPEWLLERFATPEAQAQAYAESQAEMNRMRQQMEQERQSFTQALEGLQAPAPPVPQGQAYDPAISAYTQAWEAGDAQGMLAAQAQFTMGPTIDAVGRLIDEKLSAITPAVQAAQQQARQHDLHLAEGLVERTLGTERYGAIKARVSELAQENPNYLPQASSVEGYRDAILNIVKLAEHDQLQRTVQELQQERADKLAAQTLSGGYNRPQGDPDADRAEFERIKATPTGSFSEVLANARKGA